MTSTMPSEAKMVEDLVSFDKKSDTPQIAGAFNNWEAKDMRTMRSLTNMLVEMYGVPD